MEDPYNLRKFLDAQDPIYDQVVAELRSGIKRGHWMWYIFPQVAGLALSPMSERYSIESVEEAKAYLDHPVLGTRLIECVQLVTSIEGRSVQQIFGHPDWLKFRSCLTLFVETHVNDRVFEKALDKYFEGVPDLLTIEILGNLPTGS